MNQKHTPLLDKLMKHHQSDPLSFHVPGHKNGKVFWEKARPVFEQILTIDQTEIEGLDDLHEATGVIAESQQLATDLYGTKSSYFLVGGSTVGNLVMMMTVAERGDEVLVQRNSHQSIFHGLELAGAIPVFLEPEVDSDTGLALGVSLRVLKQAMTEYPQAKAVFLTSPTYEGYAQSLTEHVQEAHAKGFFVCIDEAHGAHLISDHPSWPQSALKAGADLVVQSAHKTLPAMTMASLLHINSYKINEEKVRLYLQMLQSSSPSYPLMASLDAARAYLASFKQSDWEQLTKRIADLKGKIVCGNDWKQTPHRVGNYVQDPLKLAFMTPHRDAAQVSKRRMEDRGGYPELVLPGQLLLTLPLSAEAIDEQCWITFMKESLHKDEIKNGASEKQEVGLQTTPKEAVSKLELTFEEMKKAKKAKVPWKESGGQIAAETITPYPPGIPLVLKGERISKEQLYKLVRLINEGSSFQTGDSWIHEGMTIFLDRGE